jgi:hypothetical protein
MTLTSPRAMRERVYMTIETVERDWVPSDETFGARLALVRQHMGWGNTREAAVACGLPVESWRGWERDNRLPRDYATVCRKIADRTGVNLVWLMGADRARELSPNRPPTRTNRGAGYRWTPPRAEDTRPGELVHLLTPECGSADLPRSA